MPDYEFTVPLLITQWALSAFLKFSKRAVCFLVYVMMLDVNSIGYIMPNDDVIMNW